MTFLAPQWIFLVLGPMFVVVGVLRWVGARSLMPQASAWLIVGTIFCAVAAWLWSAMPMA